MSLMSLQHRWVKAAAHACTFHIQYNRWCTCPFQISFSTLSFDGHALTLPEPLLLQPPPPREKTATELLQEEQAAAAAAEGAANGHSGQQQFAPQQPPSNNPFGEGSAFGQQQQQQQPQPGSLHAGAVVPYGQNTFGEQQESWGYLSASSDSVACHCILTAQSVQCCHPYKARLQHHNCHIRVADREGHLSLRCQVAAALGGVHHTGRAMATSSRATATDSRATGSTAAMAARPSSLVRWCPTVRNSPPQLQAHALAGSRYTLVRTADRIFRSREEQQT